MTQPHTPIRILTDFNSRYEWNGLRCVGVPLHLIPAEHLKVGTQVIVYEPGCECEGALFLTEKSVWIVVLDETTYTHPKRIEADMRLTRGQLRAAVPSGFGSGIWGVVAGGSNPYLLWQAQNPNFMPGVTPVQNNAIPDATVMDTYYPGAIADVGIASGTKTGGTVFEPVLYILGDGIAATAALAAGVLMATTNDTDADPTYVVRGGLSAPDTLQKNFSELKYKGVATGFYSISAVSQPSPASYNTIALDAPDKAVNPTSKNITVTTALQLANGGYPVWITPAVDNIYHVDIIVPGVTSLSLPAATTLSSFFMKEPNPKYVGKTSSSLTPEEINVINASMNPIISNQNTLQ